MDEIEGIRRQDLSGVEVPLPSLRDLSQDDEAFLRAMLGFAETGAMFRGRYVEAHVARVLGAVFPATGVNEWDLTLPGDPPVPIEVKASGPLGSFDLKRFGLVNHLVGVFVRIDSPMGERPSQFTYAVAGPARRLHLARTLGRLVAAGRVLSVLGVVSERELLSAVHSESRSP